MSVCVGRRGKVNRHLRVESQRRHFRVTPGTISLADLSTYPSLPKSMTMIMRLRRAVLGAMLSLLAVGCSDSPTAPDRQPVIQLKEIVASGFPSPYYHFEYDSAGRIRTVSFASGLTSYDVVYEGGRIVEMKNTVGNEDHLDYVYDSDGHVALVKYVHGTGEVYTLLSFWYDGTKLTKLERDRRVSGGFIIDKTMTFTYYADGNLEQIAEHRPAVDSVQTEATNVARFEQYDNRINVDSFQLIHGDYLDHLVLLPGVQLQKNNAAREISTAYGLNYVAEYSYTYDERNRPVTKAGTVTITYDGNPVTVASIRADYSYYP